MNASTAVVVVVYWLHQVNETRGKERGFRNISWAHYCKFIETPLFYGQTESLIDGVWSLHVNFVNKK